MNKWSKAINKVARQMSKIKNGLSTTSNACAPSSASDNNKAETSDKGTELLDFEMELLLQHTHFTKQEIQVHHRKFMAQCPHGKIRQKQFIDIYRKFFPFGKVEKFCKLIFKKHDSDSNGEIDFFEYLTAMSVLIKGDMKEKLTMSFKIFDIDGDGSVDRNEMIELIDAIYDIVGQKDRKGKNSPEERVDLMMKKLDTNGDGVLSMDEFLKACEHDSILGNLLAPTTLTVNL